MPVCHKIYEKNKTKQKQKHTQLVHLLTMILEKNTPFQIV